MAVLKAQKTEQHLLNKGFTRYEGDHSWFEFYHNDILVAKTKTSHNNQDIDDYLIGKMSKQCKVKAPFFKEFAKCTKSQQDYIDELIKNGTIIIEEKETK